MFSSVESLEFLTMRRPVTTTGILWKRLRPNNAQRWPARAIVGAADQPDPPGGLGFRCRLGCGSLPPRTGGWAAPDRATRPPSIPLAGRNAIFLLSATATDSPVAGPDCALRAPAGLAPAGCRGPFLGRHSPACSARGPGYHTGYCQISGGNLGGGRRAGAADRRNSLDVASEETVSEARRAGAGRHSGGRAGRLVAARWRGPAGLRRQARVGREADWNSWRSAPFCRPAGVVGVV
jgi:hypothetical protein